MRTRIEVDFLKDCSDESLRAFHLARLNRDRELRKNLHTLLEELVDNLALVELSSLLRSSPGLVGPPGGNLDERTLTAAGAGPRKADSGRLRQLRAAVR